MSKIISIHSFRGGTGKSNTTANVSALLAEKGMRVGVIDTDIQSPGIHMLFQINPDQMTRSLNDYLWGNCNIEECAYDVTANLGTPVDGKVYLIPSSTNVGEISRILREGYDVGLLNDGFQELLEALDLDVLMIDTHPGLNEETLLSIAISDALVIILRPDQQDYQGTGVTVDVARRLDVPNLLLVVNKVPEVFMPTVKAQVEQTYNARVGAVMPHSDEMMVFASAGIFVNKYPDHPLTQQLRQLTDRLVAA